MTETASEKKSRKILFLKKNQQSLVGAEKYLIKRGWSVVSTHDLKVAVLKAVEFKPDYIFLAFDHQNQKVTNLPKVFKQILSASIIPFLETQSAFAAHLIKQSGFPYSLTPPMTGPKIERLIHKIKHDLDNPQAAQEEKTRKAFGAKKSEKEEMVIKIKGSNQSFSQTDSKSLNFSNLSSVLTNDFGTDISMNEFNNATGSYYNEEDLNEILKKESTMNLAAMCPDMQKGAMETDDDFRKRICEQLKRKNQVASREESERAFMDEVYAKALELLDEKAQDASDATGDSATDPDKAPSHSLLSKEILDNALKEMMEFCPDSLKKTEFEKEDSYNRRMMHLLLRQMKKNNVDMSHLSEDFAIHFKTALENSSFKTLQYLKENSEEQSVQKILSSTKKARCYMIDSENFYGYLVVASANEQHIDTNFNKLVEDRLKEYLKDLGQDIEFSAALNIQFQEVDFQAWSLEKAEFLHKSVSEGHEIAMAFFPAEQEKLAVKESKKKDMSSINITEFLGEIPVEFNLYIHLEQNDKFVHYTKGGFVLYQTQRQRLEKKGIGEMHIQNEDIPELKKYRVQNYLNKIIQEHKTSQGKKSNGKIPA
jgi:hypothetical protein